jgi:hypothetical protein
MKRRSFLTGALAAPAIIASGRSLAAADAKQNVNAWTVGLAGGLLEGTFIRYAADMAKVLDDGSNLRVLPWSPTARSAM